MTRFQVTHRTAYAYSSQVTDAYSVANLLPRGTDVQTVVSSAISTQPAADEIDERLDSFGNRVVQLGLHRPHDRFEIVAVSEVTIDDAVVPESSLSWEQAAAATRALSGDDAIAIGPFLALTAHVTPASASDLLDQLVADDFWAGRNIVEVVQAVCSRIFYSFVFDATFTDVTTPLDEVIAARRGVCQDFSHLAIAVFRTRGLAARYVSGYIETVPPEGQERTIGADASHAWGSVWIPDAGWLDFDPTNGQLPPRQHVTVAWGRDYGDVAPVRGVVIGPAASQSLTVAVDLRRI